LNDKIEKIILIIQRDPKQNKTKITIKRIRIKIKIKIKINKFYF
jgi:hypothetical protein